MAGIITSALPRKFRMKQGNTTTILDDPSPAMSEVEVMKFYANKHAALNNATLSGPFFEKDEMVFEFSTTVGTKG